MTARPNAGHGITTQHVAVLALLTFVWGINWPIMKIGVTAYPPLTFRTWSMWLGLPILLVVMHLLKVPLAVPRARWRQLAGLTLTNMLFWHVVAILSLQVLSSGRAAILGYTMPVFSALWGRTLFGERLLPRQIAGVAAALVGAALLLWHEFADIAGEPLAAFGMLVAAAVWGLGTQQLRRSDLNAPTLAVAFWMTVVTTVVMTALAFVFERDAWRLPESITWAAIVFNAVGVFGYAQPAWVYLARTLPPIASTLSIMMIPVLGVVTGAVWLGETLYWQDGAAIALLTTAIAVVLWPSRAPRAAPVPPAGPRLHP